MSPRDTLLLLSLSIQKNHSVMKCGGKEVLHDICQTFAEAWNCFGEQVPELKPRKNQINKGFRPRSVLDNAATQRPEGSMRSAGEPIGRRGRRGGRRGGGREANVSARLLTFVSLVNVMSLLNGAISDFSPLESAAEHSV